VARRSSITARAEAATQWRVIEPPHGLITLKLRELWRYRELVYFLTWRDVLVRYKQAVLGVAWAVLQPVLTMIVFSVIFGRLIGVKSGGVPYPIFSFAALLPWQLFAGAMQRAGTSLVASASLITKVYFPRLVIPLSSVLGGLVDFCISFLVLIALMGYYHIAPTWHVLWIPAFVLLTLVTSLAIGLWLSALNVLYRDVQYIIPFLIQLWMYLSPVVYPVSYISGKARIVYALNPMVGVIQGFRWALYGGQAPGRLLAVSVVVILILFVSGLYYFRRMERVFADVV
jgi:lipopolysaccharide transport system permease protein